MSKTVDEAHRVQKIILGQLLEKDRRWSELEKLTTKYSPSYTRFQTQLQWLCRKGYVTRLERGRYGITDKGKAYYDAI